MSKPKKTDEGTVRVQKTDALDQRKLKAIANRFGIPPISVRELQLGYSEDVPARAAALLEEAGFVTRVKVKPRSKQERIVPPVAVLVDETTTFTTEDDSVETTETEDTVIGDPQDEEEQS